MRKRRTPRLLFAAALLAIAGTQPACVDSFGGSIITVTFYEGVTTPAATPDPDNGRAPVGTHYSFVAFDYVYQRDADGNIVTDAQGEKVIEKSFAFKVLDFEIQPVIRRASPCFIEMDRERFPGLHSTMELEKMREVTGIMVETNPDDPSNDPNATAVDYQDVIGAKTRQDVLPALETTIKVVTTYSSALPPGVHPDYPQDTVCATDAAYRPGFLPPNNCIDDDSNAQRLAICKDYWDRPEHKLYYEGNDRVYSIPLNGEYKGTVTGINPKNGGFIGGANFTEVPAVLANFDGLAVNWQYDDTDCPLNRAAGVEAPGCDGLPDFPDGLEDAEKPALGYHYMDGVPESRTRGVIHVPMENRIFPLINGDVAVFSDLNEDNVHF